MVQDPDLELEVAIAINEVSHNIMDYIFMFDNQSTGDLFYCQ